MLQIIIKWAKMHNNVITNGYNWMSFNRNQFLLNRIDGAVPLKETLTEQNQSPEEYLKTLMAQHPKFYEAFIQALTKFSSQKSEANSQLIAELAKTAKQIFIEENE